MKRIIVVCIVCIIICLPTFCYPHSGRTDSNGGHYNRKTGDYHYHSGGPSKGNGSIKAKSARSVKKKTTPEKNVGESR